MNTEIISLDYAVSTILSMFYFMQDTLYAEGMKIARLCLVMSIGISMIKAMFGMEQIQKIFLKLGFNVVTYFIILNAFPAGVNFLQQYCTGLGEAMATNSYNAQQETMLAGYMLGQTEFLEWVVKNSEIFDSKTEDSLGNIKKVKAEMDQHIPYVASYLNIQLRDGKTGFLSMDKVVKISLTTILLMGKASFKHESSFLPKLNLFEIFLSLLSVVMIIVLTMRMLFDYIGGLLEYIFFSIMTIFILPFMLWDGTAFISKNTFSTLVNINMKILVQTIIIYMVVYGYFDILKFLYASKTFSETMADLSTQLVLIFKMGFYILLASSGQKLASMMLGGSPSLGFSDVASAVSSVASGVRTAAAVGSMAGIAAKGVASTANALSAGASAFQATKGQSAATRALAFGSAASSSRSADKAIAKSEGKTMGQAMGKVNTGIQRSLSGGAPIWSESSGGGYGRSGGGGGGGRGGGGGGGASGGGGGGSDTVALMKAMGTMSGGGAPSPSSGGGGSSASSSGSSSSTASSGSGASSGGNEIQKTESSGAQGAKNQTAGSPKPEGTGNAKLDKEIGAYESAREGQRLRGMSSHERNKEANLEMVKNIVAGKGIAYSVKNRWHEGGAKHSQAHRGSAPINEQRLQEQQRRDAEQASSKGKVKSGMN